MLLENGRYRLQRVLGAGGNGVVWLAVHSAMNSEVVLKFPRYSYSRSVEDLHQELQLLAAFSNSHPHVVNILDTGSYDGAPFVVMQYLRNGSLRDFCRGAARDRTGEAIALRRSMTWLRSIADALDFLHGQKLVHRDVKPANILLDDSHAAYLADFGIASIGGESLHQSKASSAAEGSLPYMAPELMHGLVASAASDQFSVAVSLFEFVTGRLPFDATCASDLSAQQQTFLSRWKSEPPPLWTGALWSVMDRAMSREPHRRFANCSQFAAAFLVEWNHPQVEALRNLPIGGIVSTSTSTTRPPPPLTTGEVPPALPGPPFSHATPDPPRPLKLKNILDEPKK